MLKRLQAWVQRNQTSASVSTPSAGDTAVFSEADRLKIKNSAAEVDTLAHTDEIPVAATSGNAFIAAGQIYALANVTGTSNGATGLGSGPSALYTVDTSGGAVGVTLASASSLTGKIVIIKDTTGDAGTNNITIDGFSTQQIDGSLTYTIDQDYGYVILQAEGAGWSVVSEMPTAAGAGDVVGPGSASDNALARFDATTGKLIQNSTATLSDSGLLSTANILVTDDLEADRLVGNRLTAPGGTEVIDIAPTLMVFNVDAEVPDEPYGAGWDGNTEIPTKNAIYDKIETLGGAGDVVGPASTADNRMVRFDSTTGKLIQDIDITIADPSGSEIEIESFDNSIRLSVVNGGIYLQGTDGVYIDDQSNGNGLSVDDLFEFSSGHGIFADGVHLKDSGVLADSIELAPTGSTYTSSPGNRMFSDQDHVYDYANITIPSMVFSGGTHTLEQDPYAFAMGFLFSSVMTIKNPNGEARSFSSFYTVNHQNTFQADNATVNQVFQVDELYQNRYEVINSGVINVAGWVSSSYRGTIDTGATVTYKSAIEIQDPTVNGTLTSQVGMNIHDLTSATNNTLMLLGAAASAIPAGNFAIYQHADNEYDSKLRGELSMTSKKIVDLDDGTAANDAVNKSQLDTKADIAEVIGYVSHGATAGTARPAGYEIVFWYGSVEPTNAVDDDIWVDTA